MRAFNPNWIIGRRIVGVEMNPFPARDLNNTMAHDPVITLDNGAKLRFMTEETQTDDYGVRILYVKPRRGGER